MRADVVFWVRGLVNASTNSRSQLCTGQVSSGRSELPAEALGLLQPPPELAGALAAAAGPPKALASSLPLRAVRSISSSRSSCFREAKASSTLLAWKTSHGA